MRPTLLACTSLLLILGFTGCGENPGIRTFPADAELNWVRFDVVQGELTPAAASAPSETFDLDETGGTIVFGRLSLTFPRNTFEGLHRVTVKLPDPTVAVWDFKIEPRTDFAKPVKMSIDYSGVSTADDHDVLWLDEAAGVWVDMGGKDNPGQSSFSLSLTHFSEYGLTDGTAGWASGTSGW
jgi:hypothetical protein